MKISKEQHIVVPNTHKALISCEEFQETQSKLSKKAEKTFHGRGDKSLFARLAFCVDCSTGMVFKKDRNSYVCGTYQKNGSKKCSSHNVKHDKLKTAVLSDLNELASQSKPIQANPLIWTLSWRLL